MNTLPSTNATRSPGRPITRLIRWSSAEVRAGGRLNTSTSPRLGFDTSPNLLTMTRSPFSRVGDMDSLGIQNIWNRNVRTTTATTTAMATVTTQLTAELRGRFAFAFAGAVAVAPTGVPLVGSLMT